MASSVVGSLAIERVWVAVVAQFAQFDVYCVVKVDRSHKWSVCVLGKVQEYVKELAKGPVWVVLAPKLVKKQANKVDPCV